MQAIAAVARSELRRRWPGTIGVALLVGIVGAIVLSGVAGARRSDSALQRFNAYSRSADIEVTTGAPAPGQRAALERQLTSFSQTPGVAALAVLRLFAIQPADPAVQYLAMGAATDARTMNHLVDRPRLISGRLANPAAPDEVNVSQPFAQLDHLRVGGTFPIVSWTTAQVARMFAAGNFTAPGGPKISLHVVGIVRRPLDLGERGAQGGVVILQPAFIAKYGNEIGTFSGYAMRIRTHTPAQAPGVTARAQALFAKNPNFEIQNLNIDNTGASDAIHVLAVALFIFAAVGALAGVVAISVILNRELSFARREQSSLLALGMSRRQRFAASGLRVALIATGSLLIAVCGAVALSPIYPFGIARRADPNVGLHADWLVLGVGVLAILVVVAAIGVASAWRASRVTATDRVAREATWATRTVELGGNAGLPVSVIAGLRMALESGRGDRSVPVRSAFLAAVFAVAGMTAVIVFAASLSHLASTPAVYGSRFQFKVISTSDPSCDNNDAGVSKVAGVAALDAICYNNIQLDGKANVGFGDQPIRGSIGPEVVAGVAPSEPDEVALGAKTLGVLHDRIGGTVSAAGPGGHAVYKIVGEVVFPELGDPQPVADGAWFTQRGFDTLLGPMTNPSQENFTRYLVGTFAAGADRAAVGARVRKLTFDPQAPKSAGLVGPEKPTEVSRLDQIDWFPGTLAALLAFLALVAFAHTIVTSTRRRRRELALLKTLGFQRRQVRFAVAWQATTLAAAGVVVGVPIGLLLGSVIWRAVATGVGVPTVSVVPVPLLVITLAAFAVLAVNLVAFLPARAAARLRPAIALRTE